MQKTAFNNQLLTFLANSPTPFHAVSSMLSILTEQGFKQLEESSNWHLSPGKYLVTRNDSSIIAFIKGKQDLTDTGIRMVGAHTDSPCLKVKPNPAITMRGYLSLGVEVYGGALLNPWFDRDLSLAGRVTFINKAKQLLSRLINFKRPIAIIPSLAIHLDREANTQRSINPQKDIPPLILKSAPQAKDTPNFESILATQLRQEYQGIQVNKIYGWELSFYDTQLPIINGINQEFIAGARLDNLLSCYAGMMAILDADLNLTSLLVCNDHEEVGSISAEGAQGPFLKTIIERIVPNSEVQHRAMAKSLLVSTDNAHGIHPNYADRHDPNHGPLLNAGPVIKINSNQRYATNDTSGGYFSHLCDRHQIPWQTFTVRSDMACGSTIGPITAGAMGVRTLDVGVPTFAMHSIRELAGRDDPHYLYRALKHFYQDINTISLAK